MPDAADADFEAAIGDVTPLADLKLARARELAAFMGDRDDLGATLVEVRVGPVGEWLLVEMSVDVGQTPVSDIRRLERIAVGFAVGDDGWPRIAAIRPDFPDNVPHVFVRRAGEPVMLCLSEELWQDAKRRWSPGWFIRLVRHWLVETARGALHRGDQALEPFVMGSAMRAILPADVFEASRADCTMFGGAFPVEGRRDPPVVKFAFDAPKDAPLPTVAAAFTTSARRNAAILRSPTNLADFITIFGGAGTDIEASLDAKIRQLLSQRRLHAAHLILVVAVPRTRTDGGPVEQTDIYAFISEADVRTIGVAVDLWSGGDDGGVVMQVNRKPGPYGHEIGLSPVNPVFELAPSGAAIANGLDGVAGVSIAAIGVGALGSQVVANLNRLGETISVIVDEDRLLPHNLARHAAWDAGLVGAPKAQVATLMQQRLFPAAAQAVAMTVDVADPTSDLAVLAATDLILDMAASVSVSRRLAYDDELAGRCASIFLSPTGNDLVMLVEDAARSVRLDDIEMTYYAALIDDDRLAGHLALPTTTRYARGCRDASGRIPQTSVAIHAGIAADRVRRLSAGPAASADVWRLDAETMTVKRVPIDVRAMSSFSVAGWTVRIAQRLIDELDACRAAELPSETGGVLLGTFDVDRRLIYVVSRLPSPPDSVGSRTGYSRGVAGLAAALDDVGTRTLGAIGYVGEWHSHPDGAGVRPSSDDLELYVHLATAMSTEGHPPVMLIVGDAQFSVILAGERGAPSLVA